MRNVKTKTIEIDGKGYEIRELSMEEGMPLINPDNGRMDIPALIRLSTFINGKPAQQGDISMSAAMKLMPLVMELNSFTGGDAGNA